MGLAIGAAFASFASVFMHMFCELLFSCAPTHIDHNLYILVWYRKDIVHWSHNNQHDDIHSHFMKYYHEVPLWWYGIIGIISFSFLCIAIKIIPAQLPIWAVVIAILLSFISSIPFSMLQAITKIGRAHV